MGVLAQAEVERTEGTVSRVRREINREHAPTPREMWMDAKRSVAREVPAARVWNGKDVAQGDGGGRVWVCVDARRTRERSAGMRSASGEVGHTTTGAAKGVVKWRSLFEVNVVSPTPLIFFFELVRVGPTPLIFFLLSWYGWVRPP